jgi:hypothetical protein
MKDKKTLKKIIHNTFYQSINEDYFNLKDEIRQWMTGECIPFAVALNEIFPEYKLAVLKDVFEDIDEDEEYNFNFVHAFCYHPKNHEIIIDAVGISKLDDLYDYFYDINPLIDWDIPDTKFLIDNYSGKEFASEESFDYDIDEYKKAKEFIKNNIKKYKV